MKKQIVTISVPQTYSRYGITKDLCYELGFKNMHVFTFCRYIDMAAEWADWVNSSPSQRQLFYKNREPVNTNM